jgi:molybdopterin converting factor small subunit
MFATAREAAGRASDAYELSDEASLAVLLDEAVARYGEVFAQVLASAGVWINGEEPQTGRGQHLREGDEVAILPPVSGGADNS